MGRQKAHITLVNGEQVWITGETISDMINNAIAKYGNHTSPKPDRTHHNTFKKYTDEIFDVFLRPRWKPSTATTNKFLLDKHIMPYFSDMAISDINTASIQKFFQTKQHLSKSYTKQMLIMLHEIFENAVEDGEIESDPTLSKRITLPDKVTKRQALSNEQYRDILSHINDLDGDDRLLLALLCYTGMRRGEVLGLDWSQVQEHSIHVCAEVTFKGNTSVCNQYTKSKSGIRDIPIPDELQPYLSGGGTGLVLGGDKPYTQSKFSRAWERIKNKINLYGATPHILRHTYLSALAASGVDPKTIQAIAGHADFSFTFNKYIHSNEDNVQEASSQFSDHIKKLTQKLTQDETPDSNEINRLKHAEEVKME